MGVLQSLNETSDKAVDYGQLYYTKTQEYYKLKVFQQLVLGTSLFSKIILIGSFVLIGLVFVSVGATIALAQALNNPVLACLVFGGAFFSIALIFYLSRAKINTFIIKKTSKNFFD